MDLESNSELGDSDEDSGFLDDVSSDDEKENDVPETPPFETVRPPPVRREEAIWRAQGDTYTWPAFPSSETGRIFATTRRS